MSNRTTAVHDPAKSPEENVAAGIFRLCEAVEKLCMKVEVVGSEVQTLRHAVNSLAEKKK